MLRLRQSKIFISFLIAILLVFSIEQSKPKAFAPIPFLVAIGVGMAAEQLVTMGVKAGSKALLKRQAQNYSDDIALSGKFDWAGLNPYRNKDGSITLSPTANDRAKLAGLMSGALAGTLAEGSFSDCVAPDMPITGDAKGVYSIGQTEVNGIPAYHFVNNYTGLQASVNFYKRDYTFASSSVEYVVDKNIGSITVTGPEGLYVFPNIDLGGIPANQQLDDDTAASVNAEILNCGGLYIPSTIDRVYNAPMDMPADYQLPNHAALTGHDFVINNIMPPSETEGEITWEELDQYYTDNGLDIEQTVIDNIDTYLENGTITENRYTVGEINNYYTDTEYTEKKEDVVPPGESTVPVVPTVPDESYPVATPVDRSMLSVITESYAYLTESLTTSLAAMRTVTDGATGLVDYLDTSFRWLPAEWRALFGAAFVMGVFAHFFRR